jgi:2-C-methyl-D-erythritol 4-phosphate cytidylyltransferase/2-C-methyl-D-erythritol 2,4-cyclodiphosphate synthase
MKTVALLLSAGHGSRFGAARPKQFLPLLGRPVLRHAAEALLAEGLVAILQPVAPAGEEAFLAALLEGLPRYAPAAAELVARLDAFAGKGPAFAAYPSPWILASLSRRRIVTPADLQIF